jgi:hypothetical protein
MEQKCRGFSHAPGETESPMSAAAASRMNALDWALMMVQAV